MTDAEFIQKTLKLAKGGGGYVSPNPMVGAIIVKAGRIIGQGFHGKFGGEHAEVLAMKSATESLESATLFVNLEPCSHHGKQPPCVNSIAGSGIGRVVVGTFDPNPQVNGAGVDFLRQRGLSVQVGVAEEKCRNLNRAFFKHVATGMPWVTLKIAQTIDGRITAADGGSKWISGEQARKYSHKLRAMNDAIIAGIRTVLSDDPQLDVRLVEGKNPVRVVLDGRLRIPIGTKVLSDDCAHQTVIATTERASAERVARIEQTGARVWRLPENDCGKIDLQSLCTKLGADGIASVLVEGGSAVYTSFLRQNLVDELAIFVAPKILGAGLPAIQELGIESLNKGVALKRWRCKKVGKDVLLTGQVVHEEV